MNALLHIKLKMGYMTPTVTEANVYDTKSDKLTSTSLNFGNAAIPVASITYDDLGRVKTRNSHGGNIRTSYTYDLHGWLTGLTATKANGSRLFQEDIHYADNSNLAINCYNGNISMVRWLSGDNPMGANICSGYTYTYDGLNRLTKATFGTGNIGQSGLSTNNDMGTVQYTYNANSSPTSLTRYGKKDVGYGIIDRLTYQYNGNQLKTITDTGSALHYDGAFEFSDANKAKLTQKVYDYDACGSMTYDPNRGITKIEYDLLGNPVRVQFCNGNVTEYVYSATGARLQTTYTTGISGVSSASTTIAKKQSITAKETLSKDVTYYMGNFIYTKDGLRYNFADGYTDGTTNGYHYYIRDHQDNNRVVAKYDGTIMQTTHYYPYGGILSQSTNQGVQKFKYNGKEFDTMHGLNMYDYGARQQDPAVGMFTSMDPLCEKYYNISPYSYCAGNPIRYVDPDGRDIYTLNKNGSLILDKICNGDDKISYGKQSFTIHHGAFGKTTKDQIGQDFSSRVANFKNVKEGLSFMRKVSEYTHKELNGIKLVDKRSNKTTRFQVGTWDKAHSYTSSDGHRHNAGNFRYERTENEKISLHIHTHTRFGTDGGSQNPSKLDLQLRNQADFQDCTLLIMKTSDGMLYNYNKMKNIKDTKNLELVNDERILQEYYK